MNNGWSALANGKNRKVRNGGTLKGENQPEADCT